MRFDDRPAARPEKRGPIGRGYHRPGGLASLDALAVRGHRLGHHQPGGCGRRRGTAAPEGCSGARLDANRIWRQAGDQDVQLGARHLTGAVETCPPSPTPRTANALFAESIPTVTMVLTTTSE